MSSKSDRFDLNGNPYDLSAECIRCRAEMEGATVFVVEGRIGKLRVLDFSEREAEQTYRDEAADVLDCPRCKLTDGHCCCDEMTKVF
jgi:hypothetical protein